MQNMIRCNDNEGFHFNVFFDVVDGDIQNIDAKDESGNPLEIVGDLTHIKNILASEYAMTAIEMAANYKNNLLRC